MARTHRLGDAPHGSCALQVFCLGPFKVTRPGQVEPITEGSRHKMWSLFKYLVCKRGTRVSTSEIVEVFWPQDRSSEDTGPLRTALSRLKTVLEPGNGRYGKSSFIVSTKDYCSFRAGSGVWVDCEEFEALCHEARHVQHRDKAEAAAMLRRALDLYRGDFLIDDMYSDWTVIPREHYRKLFFEASIDASSLLASLGDLPSSREVLSRAIDLDPFAEDLYIALMKIHLDIGDYASAVDLYNKGSTVFYQELGVKPSAEMKALYARAKGQMGRVSNRSSDLGDTLDTRKAASGPFECDPATFRSVLSLERRRLSRNYAEAHLVFVECSGEDSEDQSQVSQALDIVESISRTTLRKGDVICRLDENHLALFLGLTGEKGAMLVRDRILGKYSQVMTSPELAVRIRPLDAIR